LRWPDIAYGPGGQLFSPVPPTGVSLGHPRTIVSSGNHGAEKHAISTSLPHGPQIPELAPSIHIQGILKTQRDIHRAQEGAGSILKTQESPSLMTQSQQSRIHSHSQNKMLVHKCSGTRFFAMWKMPFNFENTGTP
jgi:hypothetical protein